MLPSGGSPAALDVNTVDSKSDSSINLASGRGNDTVSGAWSAIATIYPVTCRFENNQW
jgi:hypothetical protein